MSEPWLTKRELSAELKVSVRTIERQRLPHMRVGGQNRYLRSECESYLRDVPDRGHDNVIELRPKVIA